MGRVDRNTAIEQCRKNKALITLDGLAAGECIHYYDGAFWYEDGCLIAQGISAFKEFYDRQHWAKDSGWYVLKSMTQEEYNLLCMAHKTNLIHRGDNIREVIKHILEV